VFSVVVFPIFFALVGPRMFCTMVSFYVEKIGELIVVVEVAREVIHLPLDLAMINPRALTVRHKVDVVRDLRAFYTVPVAM
jgi:hypothetical protein